MKSNKLLVQWRNVLIFSFCFSLNIVKSQNQTGVWLMDGVNLVQAGTPLVDLEPGWDVISAGDFNGDDKSDILLYNDDTGYVAVWLMDGVNLLQNGEAIQGLIGDNWRPIDAGDFNGDSKSDILWYSNENENKSVVWLMDGVNLMQAGDPLENFQPGWEAISAGDFNGDNKSDILLHNDDTDNVAIWLMDGVNLVQAGAAIQGVTIDNWQPIDADDFNGDNKSDILWYSNQNGNKSAVWLMNGVDLIQTGANLGDFQPGWKAISAGDFNGDNKSDILLHNDDTDNVAIWLMDGVNLSQGGTAIQGLMSDNWRPVDAGDFNGDSKSDILWSNPVFPVSINETKPSKIVVFPNPANELIRVENINNNSKVEIYNFTGELIDSQIIQNGTISLMKLNTGYYFIVIRENTVATPIKVFVKK